jgi:hypothetical protein
MSNQFHASANFVSRSVTRRLSLPYGLGVPYWIRILAVQFVADHIIANECTVTVLLATSGPTLFVVNLMMVSLTWTVLVG